MRVSADQSITIARETAVFRSTLGAVIGRWRLGRLVYADADLRRVAIDLSRAIGDRVSVAERVADRRFMGVIALRATRSAIMAQFASIA